MTTCCAVTRSANRRQDERPDERATTTRRTARHRRLVRSSRRGAPRRGPASARCPTRFDEPGPAGAHPPAGRQRRGRRQAGRAPGRDAVRRLDARHARASSSPTSRSTTTERRLRPRHRQRELLQPRPRPALGVSLFGIGVGAVHWAKTLMPDEEVVEERHLQRGSDAERERGRRRHPASGGEAAQHRPPPADPVHPGRRASACFALPLVLQVVGSLGTGPRPSELAHTIWDMEPNTDGSPASRSGSCATRS